MEETNPALDAPTLPSASSGEDYQNPLIEADDNTAETGEPLPEAQEPEEDKEDLSQIPFFKRLGKKQFWGDVGAAIKKSTTTGVQSAAAGIKSLGKKETWVGEKGAFGKETWRPVGANVKAGFDKMKDKETWVGEKGAFGKETWAGETGVFGSNNRAKAKALVDKVGAKLKKKSPDDDGTEEDDDARKEKERIALAMLKEGQISQEEYDQLVADLASTGLSGDAEPEEASVLVTEPTEPLITLDGGAAAAAAAPAATEPLVDGRDCVDTADL